MRRVVLFAVLLLCAVTAAVISAAGHALAQDPAKPNIVLIMVDDAGVGDFGSYNPQTPVVTPNIDALVADGLRFTRAYAGSTVCGPSRSALMTGYHMGHTPIRDNFNTAHLFDREVTLAEVLKTAGYATGGYGKWGLGAPGTTGAAERQGFDEFLGFYHQVHAHSHYTDRLYFSGQTHLIPANAGFSEPETGIVSNARVHQLTLRSRRVPIRAGRCSRRCG